VAISQACYVSGENHWRAVLRQLLGKLDLEGVLIQAHALHTQRLVFGSSRSRVADFLWSVKANQKALPRQILSQCQGKRKIPFVATEHDDDHARNITWSLQAKAAPEHIAQAWIGTSCFPEMVADRSTDGKPSQAQHLFLTA